MTTTDDPFAAAPADEPTFAPPPADPEPEPAKAPAKKAAPKKDGTVSVDVKPNLLPLENSGWTVTIKGATVNDPWLVYHASSIDDALEQFNQENGPKVTELARQATKVSQYLHGLSTTSTAKPAQPQAQRQQAPQGAQQPPSDSPPCPGPGWEYKSGFKKNGRGTWQAWMPPKGSNEDPVWF